MCFVPYLWGALPVLRRGPMTIVVRGLPAPQGSKAFKGMAGGHAILQESSKKVKPWREAVKAAALDACGIDQQSTRAITCIRGPVDVQMIFTMPRPKSAKAGARPGSRPDLSKLIRSTEDALTDVGVWEDDSRVVRVVAMKIFAGQHGDSLPVPGCVIRIEPMGPV